MTAVGRRLCAAAAIALTVAGCGGGPAAEQRRWAAAVDEVCRETRERIAARGEARDVRDLEAVVARASDDVRAAIERIRRVPVSEEEHPSVQVFLAELARIEPRLSEIRRTTADGSLKAIGDLGLGLADATKRLQDRAEAAGLRECADARQFDAVHDALTAPVFATQFDRLEAWLAGALLRPLASAPSPVSPLFARHLRRLSDVVDRAERRLDDLYLYQPNRAVEAADDLGFALDEWENFLDGVSDSLRGGRRVLTPLGVKQFTRAITRLERKVRRAVAALRTDIGAQPLPEPGAEPEHEVA